jgi:hypothetical protein
MNINRLSIGFLCILLFIAFIFINKQKKHSFIETNLIKQYLEQKTFVASKYGDLTQKNTNISLDNLNCLDTKCNAKITIDEKKVNTNFTFESKTNYFPFFSEFSGILTRIDFK